MSKFDDLEKALKAERDMTDSIIATLLEACEFTLEHINRYFPELSDGSMALKLRAAIAKSKGKL